MDKLLTEYYMNELLTPLEDHMVHRFLGQFTRWQRRVLRKFYIHGPQYVKDKYKIDIYVMLTNMGILEVE